MQDATGSGKAGVPKINFERAGTQAEVNFTCCCSTEAWVAQSLTVTVLSLESH